MSTLQDKCWTAVMTKNCCLQGVCASGAGHYGLDICFSMWLLVIYLGRRIPNSLPDTKL